MQLAEEQHDADTCKVDIPFSRKTFGFQNYSQTVPLWSVIYSRVLRRQNNNIHRTACEDRPHFKVYCHPFQWRHIRHFFISPVTSPRWRNKTNSNENRNCPSGSFVRSSLFLACFISRDWKKPPSSLPKPGFQLSSLTQPPPSQGQRSGEEKRKAQVFAVMAKGRVWANKFYLPAS